MGRRACGQLSRLQKAGSGDKLWDSRKVTVYGTFGLAAYAVAPLVAVWGQPQISPSVTTVGSRLSGDSLWDTFKVTVYGMTGTFYRGDFAKRTAQGDCLWDESGPELPETVT
jgi:hypothetical protein